MRMPDITPSSFTPEGKRVTPLRIAKSLLMYSAALAAFTVSGLVMGRTLTAGESHADTLYGLASTFGTEVFTEVRPEVIWGSVIGIIVVPIFICIALAGANKAARRAIDFTDQEWYGARSMGSGKVT